MNGDVTNKILPNLLVESQEIQTTEDTEEFLQITVGKGVFAKRRLYCSVFYKTSVLSVVKLFVFLNIIASKVHCSLVVLRMNKNTNLFADFSHANKELWKKEIEKAHGANWERELTWKTLEEIDVSPFYCKKNIDLLLSQRDFTNSWCICKDLYGPEVEKARDFLKKDLGSAINIHLDSKIQLGKVESDYIQDGIRLHSFKDMSNLFEGIDTKQCSIFLTAGNVAPVVFSFFAKEMQRRNATNVSGALDWDPIASLTIFGKYPTISPFKDSAALINFTKKTMPEFCSLMIHGDHYRNAGASITQELAFTMSAAIEYLDQLTNLGVKAEDVITSSMFLFAMGSSFFGEIAKLRAARILWRKITSEFVPQKETTMNIYARSLAYNKTLKPPALNILRSTMEAMAGIIGGCNVLSLPGYKEDNLEEYFSTTMHNIQLLLREETKLHKVQDPARGSFYLENLTSKIAQKSWEIIQEIEINGGMQASLKSGLIQREIAKTQKRRSERVSKDLITSPTSSKGANFVSTKEFSTISFKNYSEDIFSLVDLVKDDTLIADLVDKDVSPIEIEPINQCRAFWSLQDESKLGNV